MRSFVVAFLLVVSAIPVSAQFVKGDKFVGLDANVNTQTTPGSSSTNSSTETQYSILPLAGWFLNEKTAIGGSLGYSHSKYTNKSGAGTSTNSNHSFVAGLFVRRYFQLSEKFYFSPEGSLTFNRNSAMTEFASSIPAIQSQSSTTNDYSFVVTLRPVFVFFPSPRWGFEASIANISYTARQGLSSDTFTPSFDFNIGSLGLGVKYYFRSSQ